MIDGAEQKMVTSVMEVYLLLSSLAILVAAVTAIILFEKRNRAGREQMTKALQSLSECVQEIQRFHASTVTKFGEADSASAQRTQYIAEAQAKIVGDSLQHVLHKLDENTASLRNSTQMAEQNFNKACEQFADRHEKESRENLKSYRESNKEVCEQLCKVTEAVNGLKASLEESIKF